MIEGLAIGFVAGMTIPTGIGLLGARFIMKHPEIFGKMLARKMMSAAKRPPKQPVA